MDNYKHHNAEVFDTKSFVDMNCGSECEATVIRADTLPAAENYPWCGGDFKIQKVLAEFIVQIDSESKIRLNEPAYEIKRIEKQVFLTQCRYVPPTNKVFIEGYIRKNIEYASRKCSSKGSGIAGSIKDTTVHIPFRVYTKVDFNGELPIIVPELPPMVARYFNEKRMGKDIREADRSNFEVFNEPVTCELEWSAIYDADIDEKGTPIDGFINEEEFQEFTDKSVVYLCMKLLQKQQVCLPERPKGYMKEDYKKSGCPFPSEWNTPIMEITEKKEPPKY